MTRPNDLVRDGLSLKTIYRRAGSLGLDKPYKFTAAEVRRILAYKPKAGKP